MNDIPIIPKSRRGGWRPNAGRKLGSKLPSTIVREKAEAAMLEKERAKQENRRLARDVLEEFMDVFRGMAALHQPIAGQKAGNEDQFKYYAKAAVECATQLAQYQSPKLRAILIPNAPPDPRGKLPPMITIDVFDEKNRLVDDSSPRVLAQKSQKKAAKAG